MESAIAPHLRCPRHDRETNPRRISDDFVPPFPAWTARSEADQEQSVMGYFGVQWRDPSEKGAADSLLDALAQRLGETAFNVERAFFVDVAGYANVVLIGYWPDPCSHAQWWLVQQGWWQEQARENDGLGLYREVYLPRSTHLETLFSAPDRMEGIGEMFGRRSAEPIQEHGYWGGMRERLPASQKDTLSASGVREIVAIAPRARLVIGHEGLALIRSGQDWSDVTGQELALYRDRIEPTLRAGMTFLSDEGVKIGCYFNRYMHVDEARAGKPCRSFGMSVWRDLESLEQWAEHHPTHKAIFGDFLEVVQALKGVLNLRLFHEVAVLQSDAQIYEYRGCHDRTGMLNGLA